MKTAQKSWLVTGLLAALAAAAEPQQTVQTNKTFTTADRVICKDLAVTEDKAWLADSRKLDTIRLFEIENPDVEQCMVTYRAKLKTENLNGKAYLQLWCRFPGEGEYFSRGLEQAVSGSNGWASQETPFLLKAGQKPDLIKLNLVVKGAGKVWIKDVQVLTGPLPPRQ